MNKITTPLARNKGKIVCLDANGAEVAPGSLDAVSWRTEGLELNRNGAFKVVANYLHPNPPMPWARRCKTRNGKFPEANPRPASFDDDESVATADSGRIEPGLDPPPSAEIIALTAPELERTVISYRDQGRSLEEIIEILSTAWENLHYHPVRRAEVEGYFNAPPKKEKIVVRSPQRNIEIDMEVSGLNREWAVVIDGARTKVMRFVANEINGQVRQVAEFLSTADFSTFFMNRLIQTADQPPKYEPLGKLWLRHSARRQYTGLIFDPKAAREVGGKLNLWQGFAIEPAQGDWHRIAKHIREVIADKSEEVETYVLNWLAFLFQNPEVPAEVALALIGGKGSGKGFFGNMLCRIFGQHSLHISSPGHLTGRFNAHQRDCCFLFADESYWYGNKLAAGALQRLITEPDLAIEGKGKDPITCPNRMHVLLAAEEGSVVPAGASERRYVVLHLNEKHAQEKAYFKPLFEEW